ncbi:Hypothetical predicted protein, partial [Xyrichtys novacula]
PAAVPPRRLSRPPRASGLLGLASDCTLTMGTVQRGAAEGGGQCGWRLWWWGFLNATADWTRRLK